MPSGTPGAEEKGPCWDWETLVPMLKAEGRDAVTVSGPDGPVAMLVKASRDIDVLWLSAVQSGTRQSLALGEASQAIHRALIALTEN